MKNGFDLVFLNFSVFFGEVRRLTVFLPLLAVQLQTSDQLFFLLRDGTWQEFRVTAFSCDPLGFSVVDVIPLGYPGLGLICKLV